MKPITLFNLLAVSFMTVAFTLTVHAQDPMIEWQNTIGGNRADDVGSIQQTADGGYILGGTSSSGISGDKTEASQGWDDYWVVKLDAAGNIVWENTIGANGYDFLGTIQQTADGGYILAGSSHSGISGDKTEASQSYDGWIIKLDGAGNIVWQNTIGGADYDYLRSIQQTADGGYILGGTSSSGISGDKTEASQGSDDYWVIKLDGGGNIVWQNTIGGNHLDQLGSIRQTADGGYIIIGISYSGISGDKTESNWGGSNYTYDGWIIKLDGAGNIVWQNTIGGAEFDYFISIQQTADGGYILAGESYSGISGDKTEASKGEGDLWVLKLDAAGNIVWQNTIGGSGSDGYPSIQQTADGGYILGGYSTSGISGDKIEASKGNSDYWIIKLDATGNVVAQNTIGGRWTDYFSSIQQTADGGYIVGGSSSSALSGDKTEGALFYDYWIVKLKPGALEPSVVCAAGERKVYSLTLVDADSDTDIGTLHDGDVLDLSVTGSFNLRANVCDDNLVESVKFQLNSVDYRKENIPFYTIAGDNGGHYDAWNITPGTYTISAIPYGSDNASGVTGTPLSVTINVIQSGTNKTGAQVEPAVPAALQVFPNPNEGSFNVSFTVAETADVKVEVYDLLGKMVYQDKLLSFSGAYSRQLDLSMYGQGIYMLKVQEGGETHTVKKIVVNP